MDVDNHKLLQLPNEISSNPTRNYFLPEKPRPLADRVNLAPISGFEGVKKVDLAKFRGQVEPFFNLP
jgi:hypothetical protein